MAEGQQQRPAPGTEPDVRSTGEDARTQAREHAEAALNEGRKQTGDET